MISRSTARRPRFAEVVAMSDDDLMSPRRAQAGSDRGVSLASRRAGRDQAPRRTT
jgi:hypothetical protein